MDPCNSVSTCDTGDMMNNNTPYRQRLCMNKDVDEGSINFAPLSFTEMAPENPGQQHHHYIPPTAHQPYSYYYTLPRHWAIDKRSHAGGRVAGALPDVHSLFGQPGEIPPDTISQNTVLYLYLCIEMLTTTQNTHTTQTAQSISQHFGPDLRG